MDEIRGWKIYKQEQFPSDNYCLIPTHRLTDNNAQVLLKGHLPSSKVAYYGSYKVAKEQLYIQIDEEDIISEKRGKNVKQI